MQWTVDGIAVSAGGHSEFSPQIVPDVAGGAIIAWQDDRNGNMDLYAQRVNANGTVQWAAGGVIISSAADIQGGPQLVTDGAGGAMIAWQDLRNGSWDIYAQRVNEGGEVQWSIDGVAISTAPGHPQACLLISGGDGGGVVVWEDSRNGTDAVPGWDIYAQGISVGGRQ